MKKWIIIVVVVLVLIIPGFIRFSKSQEKVVKEDGGVPVVVTTAKVKDAVKTMSFSSQVEGIEQAQVYPDIPGRFLRYTVDNGQWVKKDQIIAYLEQDIPGVVREPIAVKSTIPGIISLRAVDKGQLIRQQDPMFPDPPLAEVARIDKIKVEFNVPEKFFIKEGLPMKVEIPSLSKTFEGKIEKASVFYNSTTRTQNVVGVVPNLKKEILPGMFAKVWVEVARENNAISLPIDAVIGLVDKYVFKAKGGRAFVAPVTVGFTNGNSLIIKEGVSPGDTVIVVGQNIVKDSAKIDIKEIR
ncbi:efflux RND transporter periplasmic adaptor subunit [candidate division WOR-3 bacterium]|nr:efflux RND transporter periplasmic adaptor subunit [candidate division WOR-3 bacterium]